MNTEPLLTHYEHIADAPDAIARLRRFVLDLAVRGRVVPQHPQDEPASELLKRIAAEKARLDRGERVKKPRVNLKASAGAKIELPSGWAVATLSELVAVLNGRAYSKNELLDAGTPVLRVGNLFTSDKWYYSDLNLDDDKYCDKGDLIFAWSASFGPFIWNGGRVIYHYHIWKLQLYSEGNVNKLYLYNFLRQKTREIKEAGHGVSMIHMTKEKMEQIEVPLPPLAEQQRIVAKVDELIALCDRLEAAVAEREMTRDRLVAASLARLNAPDPETFQNDARFVLGVLTALTARPDQIRHLRRTILNLAVRGKLVLQDPNDEPAAELLEKIAVEFAQFVRDGVLNKPKPVKPISNSDKLFLLPPGWELARFNQIASIQSNLVDPKRYKEMPHIAPDNIESWTARLLPYVSIGEAGVFSGKHIFSAGSIIYSKIRPNLAKVTKVDFDGLCSADMYPIHALIDADFLVKFMITDDFVSQAVSEDNRVAMPKINQAALSDVLVPVPPIAEQHRIVAKVDELMAICDRLEASLTIAADTRHRLLEALLAEALAPDQGRELEAAE